MCTVVFIPNENKHYFASLRDESPKRPKAIVPQLYETKEVNYLMPKDALAGGTWIGINQFKNVIILLNGGFENHIKKDSYPLSRGKIVSALLLSAVPVVDWQQMDLNTVEPFTLIVWSGNNLFELVWDGNEKHQKKLDISASHIWSSSTLYDKQAKINRAVLFQNWIATNLPITKHSLLDFFQSKTDLENGFLINRNERLKTLSYSFVELSNTTIASIDYYDLQTSKHSNNTINLY